MSTLLRSSLVLSLLVVAGCDSNPACWGTPYSCMEMEICNADAQCESGICEMGACLDTCAGHTCPATAATDDVDPQCVLTPTGLGCRTTCSTGAEGPSIVEGNALVCSSGAPIACGAATAEEQEAWCANCGCPTDMNCVSDGPGLGECVVPLAVGQECDRREECGSDHCSPFTHTCRTEVGERCTNSSCDFCLATDGIQLCYQSCDDTHPCDAGVCLSGGSTGRFFCHDDCTEGGSCPGGFTCVDATGMPGRRVCNPN